MKRRRHRRPRRPERHGSLSRKGLRRIGMRTYAVASAAGPIEIERDRPGRWLVRLPTTIKPFHNGEFPTLRLARKSAEAWAG